MNIRGKYIFGGVGHRGNGHWCKWTFRERGTLSALIFLCPFPLKCLQMGSGANGHLEKMDIWGKGYPIKCPKEAYLMPWAHYPKMFTNGHQGKWALGVNGHLGERGPPSALKGHSKCPAPITPKCSPMGTEANGHLGQIDI